MSDTVWIDLGDPVREIFFSKFFMGMGCQIRFFRLIPGAIGRIFEIIAMHRLMLERIAKSHYSGGKDLLLVSVQFPEALLLAGSLEDYLADNSHREYYLSSYEHPPDLSIFFKPSVAVVLPADKPWEIARRWNATARSQSGSGQRHRQIRG